MAEGGGDDSESSIAEIINGRLTFPTDEIMTGPMTDPGPWIIKERTHWDVIKFAAENVAKFTGGVIIFTEAMKALVDHYNPQMEEQLKDDWNVKFELAAKLQNDERERMLEHIIQELRSNWRRRETLIAAIRLEEQSPKNKIHGMHTRPSIGVLRKNLDVLTTNTIPYNMGVYQRLRISKGEEKNGKKYKEIVLLMNEHPEFYYEDEEEWEWEKKVIIAGSGYNTVKLGFVERGKTNAWKSFLKKTNPAVAKIKTILNELPTLMDKLRADTPFFELCKQMILQLQYWNKSWIKTGGDDDDEHYQVSGEKGGKSILDVAEAIAKKKNHHYFVILLNWYTFIKAFTVNKQGSWKEAVMEKKGLEIKDGRPYFWWSIPNWETSHDRLTKGKAGLKEKEKKKKSDFGEYVDRVPDMYTLLTNLRGLLFYMIREVYASKPTGSTAHRTRLQPLSFVKGQQQRDLKQLIYNVTKDFVYFGEFENKGLTALLGEQNPFKRIGKKKKKKKEGGRKEEEEEEENIKRAYDPFYTDRPKPVVKKVKIKKGKEQERVQGIIDARNWGRDYSILNDRVGSLFYGSKTSTALFYQRLDTRASHAFFLELMTKIVLGGGRVKQKNLLTIPESVAFKGPKKEDEVGYGVEEFQRAFDLIDKLSLYPGSFEGLHLLPLKAILKYWKAESDAHTNIPYHDNAMMRKGILNPNTLRFSFRKSYQLKMNPDKTTLEEFMEEKSFFAGYPFVFNILKLVHNFTLKSKRGFWGSLAYGDFDMTLFDEIAKALHTSWPTLRSEYKELIPQRKSSENHDEYKKREQVETANYLNIQYQADLAILFRLFHRDNYPQKPTRDSVVTYKVEVGTKVKEIKKKEGEEEEEEGEGEGEDAFATLLSPLDGDEQQRMKRAFTPFPQVRQFRSNKLITPTDLPDPDFGESDNAEKHPQEYKKWRNRLEREMRLWDTAAEHDRFVMNITAFYSEIASPLMVLYQIILYLKHRGFVLKGKGKNGYITHFIEKRDVVGEKKKKTKVYIYKKGCPVITRSQGPSNVIKNIDGTGTVSKSAPFFAVVTDVKGENTADPTYTIRYWDLPIYNYDVDRDRYVLKRGNHKFMTTDNVRVRYPKGMATFGAYRFYNTLEFPLDDVFRYFQRALLFEGEGYDEKVSPTFYYTYDEK
ncbi:MAG: hypothetical protein ACTSUE_13845 [Promethearchaeota archaeon]